MHGRISDKWLQTFWPCAWIKGMESAWMVVSHENFVKRWLWQLAQPACSFSVCVHGNKHEPWALGGTSHLDRLLTTDVIVIWLFGDKLHMHKNPGLCSHQIPFPTDNTSLWTLAKVPRYKINGEASSFEIPASPAKIWQPTKQRGQQKTLICSETARYILGCFLKQKQTKKTHNLVSTFFVFRQFIIWKVSKATCL